MTCVPEWLPSAIMRRQHRPLWLQEPSFDLCRPLGLVLLLTRDAKAELFHYVEDHPSLYFVIQRRVRLEGGLLVDFQQERSEFVINHNIEPEDFEAHRVLGVFRLAAFNQMTDSWHRESYGLDDYIVDFPLELLHLL